MTNVVITALITGKKSVTLISSQPELTDQNTFSVENGDSLEWRVQDPTHAGVGSKARIKFVDFPRKEEERRLLIGGNTFEADTHGVIRGGLVDPQAFNGQYRYLVELVSPDGTSARLDCSWASSVGGASTPTGMGGGKRGGGP